MKIMKGITSLKSRVKNIFIKSRNKKRKLFLNVSLLTSLLVGMSAPAKALDDNYNFGNQVKQEEKSYVNDYSYEEDYSSDSSKIEIEKKETTNNARKSKNNRVRNQKKSSPNVISKKNPDLKSKADEIIHSLPKPSEDTAKNPIYSDTPEFVSAFLQDLRTQVKTGFLKSDIAQHLTARQQSQMGASFVELNGELKFTDINLLSGKQLVDGYSSIIKDLKEFAAQNNVENVDWKILDRVTAHSVFKCKDSILGQKFDSNLYEKSSLPFDFRRHCAKVRNLKSIDKIIDRFEKSLKLETSLQEKTLQESTIFGKIQNGVNSLISNRNALISFLALNLILVFTLLFLKYRRNKDRQDKK